MKKNANITNIATSRVPREEPVPTLRDKGKGAFSTENRRFTWDLEQYFVPTSHLRNSESEELKFVESIELRVQTLEGVSYH